MIEFNKTDEFNIETGNTVYISGLFGKKQSYVNNKSGIVKGIYLTSENGRVSYVAEILFNDNNIFFVNFDYIFKVGKKMNNKDINEFIWVDNPFDHYVMKKSIIDVYPIQDEIGQLVAVCTDISNRKHVFLYSGIN